MPLIEFLGGMYMISGFKDAFKIMFHPIDGYRELFYAKKGSNSVATVLAITLFLLLIAKRQLTGIIFNTIKLDELNIWIILVQSIILIFAFSAVNWSVCTLFDGNGSFSKIWIVMNYSLIPFMIVTIFNIILSNYFISGEQIFISIISWFSIIWTGFLIIKGLEEIHEYNIPQTLLSISATIVGLLIIIFLIVLLLSLSQQLIGFIVTISKEITIHAY